MMGEGTVNDEELVEVIAVQFQVFKPEDCDQIIWHVTHPVVEDRTYHLVPADSGGSG